MLASQAESTISIALAGAHDARLRELCVSGVDLDAASGRLVVRLTPPHPLTFDELTALLDALASARPWLRGQIAADIHRKRTPDLSFVVDQQGAAWHSSDVEDDPAGAAQSDQSRRPERTRGLGGGTP